ncbi:MAG TPA: hypothetical protein VOA41_07385 [Candidatus Dormibacteraeota bacterium]|nr:hypothetical protein [Candidatus Dormibacteraeota bacterium]
MTSIDRRGFAKLAAMAVALGPVPLGPAALGEALGQTQWEAPQVAPAKPKLTDKQEQEVNKAVQRRNQQLTAMRGRVLPYDLEPAFVFMARIRPRADRQTGAVR